MMFTFHLGVFPPSILAEDACCSSPKLAKIIGFMAPKRKVVSLVNKALLGLKMNCPVVSGVLVSGWSLQSSSRSNCNPNSTVPLSNPFKKMWDLVYTVLPLVPALALVRENPIQKIEKKLTKKKQKFNVIYLLLRWVRHSRSCFCSRLRCIRYRLLWICWIRIFRISR